MAEGTDHVGDGLPSPPTGGRPESGASAGRVDVHHLRVLDNLPQSVLQKDVNGRFVFANATFCRLVGLSLDEVSGKCDRDLFPADLAARYRSDDLRVIETGQAIEVVEPFAAAAGLIQVQASKTPVLDTEGLIVGVQCVFWDVSRQTALASELHREREWLTAMLDACPDSIYFKDEQSRFLKVSVSLATRMGLTDPRDAVGRSDTDFFDAAHAKSAREDEQRILLGGASIIAKVECEGLVDGVERWVETTKMPLRDQAGRVVGTFGLSRDITELRRAQSTVEARTVDLERSRDRYRMLVEGTQAAPWEIDGTHFRLTYVSPRAAALFGQERGELGGRTLLDFVHPDDRTVAASRLAALVHADSGAQSSFDCRLQPGDGHVVHVRCFVAAQRFPAGATLVRGVTIDLTTQRQLELELHQAQKLESIGRLAAGVAHEINTPVQFVSDSVFFVRDAMADLAALVGQYRRLGQRVPAGTLDAERAALADAEREADLDYILDQIPLALGRSLEGLERVTTIVRSMKEFAHPGSREMGPVDLNAAVESTITIAKNEYKYVADLELDLGVVPSVVGHGGDIKQALLNILVNAAHAVADSVQGVDQRGHIRVRTYLDGNSAVVSVSDTGQGIAPEAAEHIFEPFFTTKGVGRGTGQGLAIARAAIVGKHGGDITFETVPGEGTTFFVRLPIAPEPLAEGRHDN